MPLHVLAIDDSAVVRQALSQILGRAGMIVTTANDPIIAMEKMRRERPDVIVLDLEMPRMDGLTFLHKLMAEDPLPVVICSSLAAEGCEVVAPQAQSVLPYYPLPNTNQDLNSNQIADDYVITRTQYQHRDNFDLKLTYQRTQSHSIWGKFSLLDNEGTGNNFILGFDKPSLGDTRVYVGGIGHTWTISPTYTLFVPPTRTSTPTITLPPTPTNTAPLTPLPATALPSALPSRPVPVWCPAPV